MGVLPTVVLLLAMLTARLLLILDLITPNGNVSTERLTELAQFTLTHLWSLQLCAYRDVVHGDQNSPHLKTQTTDICYLDARMMVLGQSPQQLLVTLTFNSLLVPMPFPLPVLVNPLNHWAVAARILLSPTMESTMIPMMKRGLISSVCPMSNTTHSLAS